MKILSNQIKGALKIIHNVYHAEFPPTAKAICKACDLTPDFTRYILCLLVSNEVLVKNGVTGILVTYEYNNENELTLLDLVEVFSKGSLMSNPLEPDFIADLDTRLHILLDIPLNEIIC